MLDSGRLIREEGDNMDYLDTTRRFISHHQHNTQDNQDSGERDEAR